MCNLYGQSKKGGNFTLYHSTMPHPIHLINRNDLCRCYCSIVIILTCFLLEHSIRLHVNIIYLPSSVSYLYIWAYSLWSIWGSRFSTLSQKFPGTAAYLASTVVLLATRVYSSGISAAAKQSLVVRKLT